VRAFAAEHNIELDVERMTPDQMRLMQQHGFWGSLKSVAKKAGSAAMKALKKVNLGGMARAAGGLLKKAGKIAGKIAKKAGKVGLKGLKALGKGLAKVGKGVIKMAAGALDEDVDGPMMGSGTVGADEVIRDRYRRRRASRRRREQTEYRRREDERREQRRNRRDRIRNGQSVEPFNGVGRRFWGKDADIPEVWREPDAVEDCVACQYVWKQVEQDVGATPIVQTIYDSFTHNSNEAMRSAIFYPGVQSMSEALDDMANDYMLGYTVNQICENSMLCRPRNLDAFLNYQRVKGPHI